MSHVQEQQKRLMIEHLNRKKELSLEDVQNMVYALQVASGNATGVGKIKGIIQYLEENPIYIIKQNGTIKINNKFQLADLIRTIDEYINITSDRDFKDCF